MVGSLVHLWVMPALGELLGTVGAQAWGRMVPMILINHDLAYVIVGPILLAILYPLAKARRLYWRDRYVPAPASL